VVKLRLIAAVMAALLLPLSGVAGAQTTTALRTDLRLLVISADDNETDAPAITAFLDQVGMPYTKIVASKTPLTADMLEANGAGKFSGIVLTTGNLTYFDPAQGTWQSAMSPAQWDMLRAYQTKYKARSVTSFSFPEASNGMSYDGYTDTLSTPTTAKVTTAGSAVFPYLQPTAQIPLRGAWLYLGKVLDATKTTPLITTTVNGVSYPVASVTRFDGYEQLAITIANNPNLIHSILFSTGWINWVSGGVNLGARKPSIDVQIDDLFNTDSVWNTTTHQNGPDSYRNVPRDLDALANWQRARAAKTNTRGLTMEFAYNGAYAGNWFTDALAYTAYWYAYTFNMLNHTASHFNMDCGTCENPNGVISTTAAQIQNEIRSNITIGRNLGLRVDATAMVQPDISGIDTPANPMAQKAAADAGVRTWISDTSRASQNNPSFNTGFYAPGDSRLFISPRRPSNLFVAASTPAQWTDIYNTFYAPGGLFCSWTQCFDAPQTYAQILDRESDYFLRFLLLGDNDSWMFHTPNVRAYDGTRSVLSDVLDATFNKYDALVRQPITNLSLPQVAKEQQARAAYNAAGVTATRTACSNITLKATKAAVIPLTGVRYVATNSKVTVNNGQPVSEISLAAGQQITVPLPAC
jgi:hypothetical protein